VVMMCHVPASLQVKLKAGDWAKEVAVLVGGKGGGGPESGQGFGTAALFSDDVIHKALQIASQKMQS
jgi:alanyl-tRNA synthetase